LKVALASRQGAETSLASGHISRGGVYTQQGELAAPRRGGNLRRGHLVRKVHFDGTEACPGGRLQSLRQRSIGPEQPDIGGKARQPRVPLQKRFGSAPYYRRIRLVA
jgi:hypothetical protein